MASEPNVSSPLPNKSDIRQAPHQTTVLSLPPRSTVSYLRYSNRSYLFQQLNWFIMHNRGKVVSIQIHSNDIWLIGSSNGVFTLDAIYQKLSFPNVKTDWNSRGYVIFNTWRRNCKRDSNHLLIERKIERQRNVCELKLLFLNCARWMV